MLIRSEARPVLWYRISDKHVEIIGCGNAVACTHDMLEKLMEAFKMAESVRKELRRSLEAYKILRVTPPEERTNNWRVRMASTLGTTYGKLQQRIMLGEVVWEEKSS
jgi:hypothetical protein